MALIECRGLTKCYDTRHPEALALRDVDLDVSEGELVAIMGPSGCGKSTLLHLIGGLDLPTAGIVTLDGQRFDNLSEAQRAIMRRRRVGYVFQFFNLISNLTVADNVELPMLLAGRSRRDARSHRKHLLERLGVGAFADRPPSELSGGQQQRVALARALANDPSVLLADEPTGNLDSEATGEVMGMLKDHHRAGQTIVLVTHDRGVGEAADRLLHMQDGAFLSAEPSSLASSPGG